jgi:serine/threonine-protein kinase RsbW
VGGKGETMIDEAKGLQLCLPSKPENVAVVRHAIAGLADAIGMDEPGIADLKSVVTEACMNVVVHAYDDVGPMEVDAIPEADGLTVVVRDYGGGIRPRAEFDRASLKLGLPLIAALAQSFEIAGGLDQGTRITMRVALRSSDSQNGAAGEERAVCAPDATEMTVDSPQLLAPVLSRVLGALAARRDLTIDRLSDAVLLTDALAERAPDGFPDGRVRLALEDEETGIGLRLGPMASGGGERLLAGLDVPQVGGSLERLADEVVVTGGEEGEYLLIRFSTTTG